MNNDNFGVALVKELCPVCAKKLDSPTIMNTRLTKGEADKVKELHGKVVGYAPEPCAECKGYMKKGVIVIGIDAEKTGDDKSNPYRTGHFSVIKAKVFKKHPHILKSRVCFVDYITGLQLGYFKDQDKYEETVSVPG